MVLGFELMSIN